MACLVRVIAPGGVVEWLMGSGLENQRSESFRGFESRPLRFN